MFLRIKNIKKGSGYSMKKLIFLIFACAIIAVSIGSCGSGSLISAGNINNYGYVLVDGNDIYYTKVIITDMNYYGNIYKYNTATKQEEIVAETIVDFPNQMNAFLTLYNGDLYFLPYFLHESIAESSPYIYKVKPDGKNIVPEPVFEDDASITFMQIVDRTLYYYDDAEGILYSMNPNGTNRKAVCEAMMSGISISGGKAYFTDYEFLQSVSLKGGEPELIFDFSELEEPIYLKNIVVDGNFIYYSEYDGTRIGRIRTNGTNNEDIYISGAGEYINFFNVSGDMMYIVVENYGREQNHAVIAVSASGGNSRVIVSDSENLGDILPVLIWGETIYLSGMPIFEMMESEYVWFTVKKSGGNLVPWKAFSIVSEDYSIEEDWDDENWDDWDDWDDENWDDWDDEE